MITGGASQTANLGMLIRQMSGYQVRIGLPLGTMSCQDVEGVYSPSSATSLGLIQAAIEEECMNCATCEETYHTEVETLIEEAVPTVELAEEEVIEAEPVEVAPVEESPIEVEEIEEVEEEIEDEEIDEEVEEPEDIEEVDDDYDEEIDDEIDGNAGKRNGSEGKGLIARIKFIWNKINDDTDDIIDDMTKK